MNALAAILVLVSQSLTHGFADQSYIASELQSEWEEAFLKVPLESYAYEHLAIYTSEPHIAGSFGDRRMAEYTLRQFQEFGLLNSEIIEYEVLLSYPVRRSVQMTQPVFFNASLQEDYIPVDPTTNDPRIVPTFNGYAPSGEATGELIYVNYGSMEDFEYLEKIGVDVKGKIAIARYGGLFRGTKAMIAQWKGMKGLLIYSDPADDGYKQGEVYPEGPWRPESGVQRGSVVFTTLCPGDPRNPLCSNDPNFNYTDITPAIPVQPISWGDAYPLLSNIKGNTAPSSFQGGLNFTYQIGPGPAVVTISLEMDFVVTPIWDVVAMIPGSEEPDKAILMGNHRDAWVFGATDPNSGSATLLEVARGYGELLKQGWQPKRTIYLCSWDAEEYGMVGSTTFADAHATMLTKSAVAYLNVDIAVCGPNFYAGATPSLVTMIQNATRAIIDPNTKKPLSEIWSGGTSVLGSGSDFTAFLDRYGVPSIDIGFGGPYGVYHSIYDDIHWMNNFGDPTYAYHKICAQLWGLIGLRLADSSVLPFNYTTYAQQLGGYVASIQTLLTQANHTMDLSALNQAIEMFGQAAGNIPGGADLNNRLVFTERQFLDPLGLPERPYYRHVVQAPGFYTGYAADVFPGVSLAIQQQNWTQAEEQYQNLIGCLNNAAVFLTGGTM